MMRPVLTFACAVLVILAGCTAPTAKETVTISHSTFVGGDRTVKSGDSLGFTNADEIAHKVSITRAGDPKNSTLKDAALHKGDTTIFRFPTPGTYYVWCPLHSEMMGKMSMTVTAT